MIVDLDAVDGLAVAGIVVGVVGNGEGGGGEGDAGDVAAVEVGGDVGADDGFGGGVLMGVAPPPICSKGASVPRPTEALVVSSKATPG